MKKIFLYCLAALLFTSCEKNNDANPPNTQVNANNSISATINGVDRVWNVTPHCIKHDNSGLSGEYQLFNMTAYDGITADASGVYLVIMGLGTVTTKTYGEYTGGEGASFTFMDNGSLQLYGNANNPGDPFTLKVTSLTSTVIEGEFHGTIHKGSDVTEEETRLVTNGKFSLTRE